jgi:hypothetical protein
MPENSDPRPASHWGTRDPAAEPDRDVVIGVGRMVTECRTRLGERCTQADVLRELQARGLEVDENQVRQFWDAG